MKYKEIDESVRLRTVDVRLWAGVETEIRSDLARLH